MRYVASVVQIHLVVRAHYSIVREFRKTPTSGRITCVV